MPSSEEGSYDLVRALVRMSGVVVNDQTLATTLRLITDLAVSTIPAVDGVSVSLAYDGRLGTAAHSDDTIASLDDRQYELDEGPCVQAFREGRVMRLAAGGEDRRWPSFEQEAQKDHIASMLSNPLVVTDGDTVGALNLYSRSTAAFGPEEERIATAFAEQAAVALATQRAYADAQALAGHLQEALTSRDIIGQAKGILIAREHCDSDTAFDMLRSVSQRTNRKLRDVARDLIDRTGRREF